MSGIAALIHFDGREAAPSAIAAMTGAMAYRARDGAFHWTGGGAALGHCTMHAMAESRESQQPLASDRSGAVLVMDGYLANWEELRLELLQAGAFLRDRSDAELVLRAYETWGEGLVDHLDGEFAVVIWDARQRRAVCVSDHIGLRPLHYAWDGTTLVVASDLQAVVTALEGKVTPNMGFIAELASAAWLSNDQTVFSEIARIEPAHLLVIDADGIAANREYWTITLDRRVRHPRDEDYFAEYREVYGECVRRAARSDSPVGCEVSGGLDSSAVFAMAHHLHQAGSLPAPELRGYTMRGPAGSDADEVEFARATAEHLGVPLHEVPMQPPPLDWYLDRLRRDGNIPPYPNCAIAESHCMAMAADGCRVALNGQGGDHWLGGTGRYYYDQLRRGELAALWQSWRADRSEIGLGEASRNLARQAAAAALPQSVKDRAKSLFGQGKRNSGYAVFPLLRQDLQDEFARRSAAYNTRLSEEPILSARREVLRYPFDRFMATQHNRMLAQAGLEPRHPMFSRRFVEYAVATPEHLRYRGASTRFIHRRAMAGLLPAKVADRRTEAVFNLALDSYLPEIAQQLSRADPEFLSPLFSQEGIDLIKESCCNATSEGLTRWRLWSSFICLQFLATTGLQVSRN